MISHPQRSQRLLLGAAVLACALTLAACEGERETPVTAAAAPARLETIRARGHLVCGLTDNHPGRAVVRGEAEADGFEADHCRAVAAAIFGEARVRFAVVATADELLGRADIDIVLHGLTATFGRELTSGLAFGPTYLHDGQAFLIRGGSPTEDVALYDDPSICVEADSRWSAALTEYAERRRRMLGEVPLQGRAQAQAAFLAGVCDVLSMDATVLFAFATEHAQERFTILDERISKEPLAAAVRAADVDLLAVLRWTTFALIEAEERGVTQATAASMPELAEAARLGLAPTFARDAVRAAGNYGEIYARHFLRSDGPRLERGLNQLWTRGGLLMAPPLR